MFGHGPVAGVAMKHGLWRKWTVDKPAAFGDWLWDVFVVQLAATLDRVTLRDVIAFIPVAILIFAYLHRIPIPPELMLVGDLLAYIDVFAMVFLLSMIGRVGVVLYIFKRTIDFAISCVLAPCEPGPGRRPSGSRHTPEPRPAKDRSIKPCNKLILSNVVSLTVYSRDGDRHRVAFAADGAPASAGARLLESEVLHSLKCEAISA